MTEYIRIFYFEKIRKLINKTKNYNEFDVQYVSDILKNDK